jgi:hypothetical protein
MELKENWTFSSISGLTLRMRGGAPQARNPLDTWIMRMPTGGSAFRLAHKCSLVTLGIE